MMRLHSSYIKGFTLIEILIVVAIIGIMAAVLTVNYSSSSEASRDAERQADLRKIQAALEAYKNRNGKYPPQATSTGPSAGGWSGQLGTDFAPDDGTGQYIVGLAPEYIPVLPADPKLNGSNSGYVYRVDNNSNPQVYKLMALRTVESETVTWRHEFSSCDINPDRNADIDPLTGGWCTAVYYDLDGGGPHAATNRPPWCAETDARFQSSYAIWGGLRPLWVNNAAAFSSSNSLSDVTRYVGSGLATSTKRMNALRDTTNIICR